MLTLDEARGLLAGAVKPLPAVEVELAAALDCRIAEAAVSDVPIPSRDVSAMDGFVGETANGTWTLIVRDHAGADTGDLDRWRLVIAEE